MADIVIRVQRKTLRIATASGIVQLATAAPASVTKAAAVVGTVARAAREDHKHDVTTAAAGALAVGDTAAEGSATTLARSDHRHSLAAPSAPADVTKAAAATGSASTAARADHKHDVATAAAGTAAIGDAAGEGSSSSLARADHVHAVPAPAAPANVTKAAAGAGSATTFARADHKHDATTAAAGAIAIGDSAAEGSASSLARSDHTHSVAAPSAPANVTKAAAAAGSSGTFARADHKHDVTTATAGAAAIGDAAAEGSASSLARSDHRHSSDAAQTPVWTGVHDFRARLQNSIAALNLGTAATSGHSLGAGDTIIGGKLEVDGQTYHDADVSMGANTIRWTGPLNTGKKFLEITPATGPGKYNFIVSDADNPGDPTRKDHVMFIGYNVGSGGGPEAGGESQFSDQWESHWDDGGGIIRHERHMRYTTADGLNNRAPFSFEIQISGGASPYYVTGAIRMDQFVFGPNTTGATSRITITTGNIVDCDSTVQLRKVGGSQWIQHFTGSPSNVYENLIYLDTTDQYVLIGGQTFSGIKLGVPFTTGRTLTIFGNDCGASSNQAGGDLRIGGGRGRGTGVSGEVIFATAAAGSTGSTQNALTDRWKIATTGRLVDIVGGLQIVGRTATAADPTTTELPADKCVGIHKNTNSGAVFLAYNDAGTIKKVALT